MAAEGDGVAAGAGRRDEDPAFVLFGLMLVGDAGESELVREPGDCLVIVADDERGGRGIGASCSSCRGVTK